MEARVHHQQCVAAAAVAVTSLMQRDSKQAQQLESQSRCADAHAPVAAARTHVNALTARRSWLRGGGAMKLPPSIQLGSSRGTFGFGAHWHPQQQQQQQHRVPVMT
jgi:hypothetical protein